MESDVKGVTQIVVAVLERSGFGLQDAPGSTGCDPRRACGVCA
jgi:hypothetical protein